MKRSSYNMIDRAIKITYVEELKKKKSYLVFSKRKENPGSKAKGSGAEVPSLRT